MKVLVLIALAGLLIAGCSKQNTVVPAPDGGSVVAGTYPLTYVRADSAGINLYEYTLPYTAGSTTLAGTLTARRDSASAVFLTQTIQVTGQSDQTSIVGEIHLQANGSSYDMYLNNQKIGTADGTTLSIDDSQTDATTKAVYRTQITGKKSK